MLRRCQSFSVGILLTGCAGILFPAVVSGQTGTTEASSQTVLKVSARTVVVDVVVTGKDGKPVQGLHAGDFLVAEDGKPQAVTFFEEHSGTQAGVSRPDAEPDAETELPPNTFTNLPRVPPSDSLTVLLLDSLNTPQNDQRFVHAQILAFLKSVQPGRRMAIFTLSNRLRFVQGFSDDPAALAAGLNNAKLGTNPTSSPLLQTDQEKNADQQVIANMQQYDPGGAAALGDFLREQKIEQTDVRAKLTLAAFQELGHYLAGFPGRKNVVWFSGAFPLALFPPPGGSIESQRDYDEELRKTDVLLSAAQVAVYPIGAEGLAASVLFDADHQLAGASNAQGARQQIAMDTKEETSNRDAADASMDVIAHDTGGIAIRNTNGLVDAIDRVLEHGTFYYTLTYTPSNAANDGKFRKIQVKIAGLSKGVQLAYRQGYYALDARGSQKLVANAPVAEAQHVLDPLRPLMDLGMPASTQVPLVLGVQRSASDAVVAGDNASLSGTRTRYGVTFTVNAKDLQFHENPDGSEHSKVEATLLVYDQEGKPLNWLVRRIDLDMDAARFARVQSTGIHFKLEIDAPKEGLVLRSGIYDLNAEKAGTLEVALGRIAAETPAIEPTPLKVADNVSTRPAESAARETVKPSTPVATQQAVPSSQVQIASNTLPSAGPAPAGPGVSSVAAKPRQLAFWSQPAENIDPVLLHFPTDNEGRYQHLRQDFRALHCISEEMEEQPIPHKEGRNLVCTLPGEDTTAPIVVAARYDRRSGNRGASERWGEALMLPLLFNALRAQPRQHTFVFVALDGEAGEKTFFNDLRKKSTQMPSSLVVLDALGLGAPTIYTSEQADISRRSRQRVNINRILAAEAMISAQLLQMPSPVSAAAADPVVGRRALMQSASDENENWIMEREDEIPSILIHSAAKTSVSFPERALSPEAFHEDFNFVAYLLCRIDYRLALSGETAAAKQ